jgi:hypothetical protein
MSHNLYWAIYQNLEEELIELSNNIHVDDNQLKVYSMKIAEVLIRVAVEVESIAKELYFQNGGDKPDDNQLFFDTDCLNYLNEKWILSKKKIQVVFGQFYFDIDENKILTPLEKVHLRGKEKWIKAYQAIKHNRRNSLKNANLKNLIHALAGLFILNLYYKNEVIELGNDVNGTGFDASQGSKIFAVLPAKKILFPISINDPVENNNDDDEYIYVIFPNKEDRDKLKYALIELVDQLKKELLTGKKISEKDLVQKGNKMNLGKVLRETKYEAILNKRDKK